jgi:hypothetical protein
MVSELAMLDHVTFKPAVTAKGLHCAAVSGAAKAPLGPSVSDDRHICSRLLWTPAMDILSSTEQQRVVRKGSVLETEGQADSEISDQASSRRIIAGVAKVCPEFSLILTA